MSGFFEPNFSDPRSFRDPREIDDPREVHRQYPQSYDGGPMAPRPGIGPEDFTSLSEYQNWLRLREIQEREQRDELGCYPSSRIAQGHNSRKEKKASPDLTRLAWKAVDGVPFALQQPGLFADRARISEIDATTYPDLVRLGARAMQIERSLMERYPHFFSSWDYAEGLDCEHHLDDEERAVLAQARRKFTSEMLDEMRYGVYEGDFER